MSQRAAEIDIFLSYKREDRATAKALAKVLAARGYSVWWDIDLLPGDRFVDAVTEVIKRASVTIVLWSEQAVTSDYVRGEAEVARKAGKLIPARLDDCDLPIPFNALQTLDLRSWQAGGDEAPLAPLLTAMEHRLGKPSPAEQAVEVADADRQTRETEAALWRSISEKGSAREYEHYLKIYPQGVFADLAEMRIEAVRKPDVGRTIVKLGGIAGALAADIGLFILVREEFRPMLPGPWQQPPPALVQKEPAKPIPSATEPDPPETTAGSEDRDPALEQLQTVAEEAKPQTRPSEVVWRKREEERQGSAYAAFKAAIYSTELGPEIELDISCRKAWGGEVEAVGNLAIFGGDNELVFRRELRCRVHGSSDGSFNRKNPRETIALLDFFREELNGMKAIFSFGFLIIHDFRPLLC